MLDRSENEIKIEMADKEKRFLSDSTGNEIKIEMPGEEKPLVSDYTDLGTLHSKVTTLIQNFNKYTSLANKIGKATLPAALILLCTSPTSVYFFIEDPDKVGLIILAVFSFVFGFIALGQASAFLCDVNTREVFVHYPPDYNTKRDEALNLIKKYNIIIKDNDGSFKILNALNQVKNIIEKIEKYERTRSAIKTNLVPTLFNKIDTKTTDLICEEIFEYAGLSRPKRIR